jgi:glycine betaine transporter
MKINPLLVLSLLVTGAIALWGLLDSVGLQAAAGFLVGVLFTSRAWFIMLTVNLLLLVCLWLMVSPVGKVKLGQDDEEPEFSTGSWISMLFAAGMGVGLLYWGTAEPLSHFALAQEYQNEQQAAGIARFITNFHWGFHAWAIYAITALVIAYFSFRKGCPSTLAQPICFVFGDRPWTRIVGWISDFLAIIAIAIGVGGSIAMGIFQIASGLEIIFKLEEPGVALPLGLFALLCLSYMLPLLVDLSKGMARLSNLAMLTAGTLMVYVLLVGQTHYMMNGIVGAIGEYLWNVIPHGFNTFAFFDDRVTGWFQSWTLTYMVWWLAWAPFVGIFIARISRGRTIRQFILGVVFVPTAFSILWFGVFGGTGFFEVLNGEAHLLDVVRDNVDATTFIVLQALPLSTLTSLATILAAFLFVVTSVVSAAFVLGMLSTGGSLDPPVKVKLIWGVVLGALGLVMLLSNSIEAVRSIIALGAMPFVFIVLLLAVCLLRALREEVR